MKIVVSERAKHSRDQIARYILLYFGKKKLLEFREAYHATKRFITENPNGGAREMNLSTDEVEYRYTMINGLTKLVYRVADDYILVADMWDVRREPPQALRDD